MSRAGKTRIIAAVIFTSFIQGLQYCVSPVLGQIERHFYGVGVSLVQMLVTMPGLLAMWFAVASGWIVLWVSKKKLLMIAGLVAGVTGFLPFVADSFWLLFVCRAVYGISLGLATALSTAVVAEFFNGDERVTVMGIQAASVGAGMTIVMSLSGILGSRFFTGAYFLNVIGFLAFLVIALFLPDTGRARQTKTEKLCINRTVIAVSLFGALEFLFLITFTTNIAMHLSGAYEGDSVFAGVLTSVFSGIQIAAGFLLGYITKATRRYTMPAALCALAAGCLLLALFPDRLLPLIAGAVLCGFSQGVFIPTGMVAVAGAVKPVATAMASAVFTCGLYLGQFLSPVILNLTASAVFGQSTTGGVYLMAGAGAAASAVIVAVWVRGRKTGNV